MRQNSNMILDIQGEMVDHKRTLDQTSAGERLMKELLGDLRNDAQQEINPNFLEELNKALHALAAHPHQYACELKSLDETLSAMMKYHDSTHSDDNSHDSSDSFQLQQFAKGHQQVVTQL
jgi:hypothetical protein